jgi:hypothetical protein
MIGLGNKLNLWTRLGDDDRKLSLELNTQIMSGEGLQPSLTPTKKARTMILAFVFLEGMREIQS